MRLRREALAVVATASLLISLDALKPLVIDDTAYVAIARQIAAKPTDPFGFELFWYQEPTPALAILAPPVLPYWLGLGIAALGERPPLWKVWLLPFALLLGTSIHAIARRLAPGLEVPLLWLAIFSPVVLPALNLMLDVPALALGLAGMALQLRADEERRPSLALAAGLVFGVALQTKYGAVVLLAASLLHAVLERRWSLALRTASVATGVFAVWEALMRWRYGHSQFLDALGRLGSPLSPVDLVALLGSLAPALGLLALVALGCGRRTLAAASALPSAAVLALPWLPHGVSRWVGPPWSPPLTKNSAVLVFVPLGLAVAGILLFAEAKLLLRARPPAPPAARSERRLDLFVAGWLVCEIVGFFVLSPFPAARRTIGLWVAALFGVGRLAASRPARDRLAVNAIVAWGAAFGLLHAAADISDARAQQRALAEAEAEVRDLEHPTVPQTIWFVGHWGWQFYAEARGMRAVVPEVSRLSAGDWLLVPRGIHQQRIRIDPLDVRPQRSISIQGGFPWSTLPWAYIGSLPLRSRLEPPDRVLVYRVERSFVPARDRTHPGYSARPGGSVVAVASREPDSSRFRTRCSASTQMPRAFGCEAASSLARVSACSASARLPRPASASARRNSRSMPSSSPAAESPSSATASASPNRRCATRSVASVSSSAGLRPSRRIALAASRSASSSSRPLRANVQATAFWTSPRSGASLNASRRACSAPARSPWSSRSSALQSQSSGMAG